MSNSIARPLAGAVRGTRVGAAIEFLGVPYAGARRFAAPDPLAPWPGVRDASAPGPAAPQPPRPAASWTHGPVRSQSEDCLNLNIWTPELSGARAVLVFIHGGGFAIGHGAASIYRGAWLAAAGDVVVVTLNYRLGSLGWLAHPRLAAGPGAPAGNWGLLDQIAALRWVADNIAAFGGDPRRVAVVGQSAGALSAINLLTAPPAAGLFRRLVLQSPPMGDLAQGPDRAEAWALALSELATGAPGFDADALRRLPAAALVDLHERLLGAPRFRGTRGGALPTLEPFTIPCSATEHPGARAEVDVLIGHTADEGTFFTRAPWLEPTGGGPSPEEVTEALIARPLAAWAHSRASAGGRVWRYRFDHPVAGPRLGATHTSEVPLLFGSWRDGGPGERLGGHSLPDGLARTEEVSAAIRSSWLAFIRGEPPGWDPLPAGDAPGELGVFGGPSAFTREPLRAVAPADARARGPVNQGTGSAR